MPHNDAEYDDSIMLSESLESIASQAMELKKKIEAGLQLPSWAEYKVYQAYDAVNKALGTAYPGRYEMGSKKASVFAQLKEAALNGITYDPENKNIKALQAAHGPAWKKVWANSWGLDENQIQPISPGGRESMFGKQDPEKKASVFDMFFKGKCKMNHLRDSHSLHFSTY